MPDADGDGGRGVKLNTVKPLPAGSQSAISKDSLITQHERRNVRPCVHHAIALSPLCCLLLLLRPPETTMRPSERHKTRKSRLSVSSRGIEIHLPHFFTYNCKLLSVGTHIEIKGTWQRSRWESRKYIDLNV